MSKRARRIHYGWFILLMAFLAMLSVQGVRLAFGAFIAPWEAQFHADLGTLSMISMVSFVVYGASQPLFGSLVDRIGVRKTFVLGASLVGVALLLTFFAKTAWQITLLYGVVASIGFGAASGVAGTVAVTNWFQERRGLALALIQAGSSAGQLVLVPLCLYLVDATGWKTTVLVLGIFLVVVMVPLLAVFLRTSPQEKGMQPFGASNAATESTASAKSSPSASGAKQRLTWRDLMARRFWFLALSYFICGYTTMGLMDTHLIPYAHDHGFSTPVTGTTVSLLAAFNIIGSLGSGQIADRWSKKKFLAILYVLRALTIILLLMVHQPAMLMLFGVLFGLVDFATVAPTSLLAADGFKRFSVGPVLGWLSFAHQMGSAAGAYLTGLLHDWTGGYESGFAFSVVLLVAAAALCLLIPTGEKAVRTDVKMGA